MHLTEIDTDTQVKRYWNVREQWFPQEFLEELEEAFKGFQDLSRHRPGSACEFLFYLDLGFAREMLFGLYKREPDYPAEATQLCLDFRLKMGDEDT